MSMPHPPSYSSLFPLLLHFSPPRHPAADAANSFMSRRSRGDRRAKPQKRQDDKGLPWEEERGQLVIKLSCRPGQQRYKSRLFASCPPCIFFMNLLLYKVEHRGWWTCVTNTDQNIRMCGGRGQQRGGQLWVSGACDHIVFAGWQGAVKLGHSEAREAAE